MSSNHEQFPRYRNLLRFCLQLETASYQGVLLYAGAQIAPRLLCGVLPTSGISKYVTEAWASTLQASMTEARRKPHLIPASIRWRSRDWWVP